MNIEGKIIEVLEEQSGEGAKGAWRKQEYILETEAQYPKKLCFAVWGEKIDEFDKGLRNIMNYGHTFGHAIESLTKFNSKKKLSSPTNRREFYIMCLT